MAEHEKHQKTNSNTDTTGLSYNYIEKSIIEDLLKCDLCNVIFDINVHSPLMLKCGHTFCRRCISSKSNNLDKNINKSCPFDKMKNVMSIDSAIPNLKLEYIVKKLTNLNKKQIYNSKFVKKGNSPIKSNNSNNAVNTNNNITNIINNNNNNITHNIKNNNDNNNNTNVNTINKKKENSTSNSNKNKNIINQKKINNKANNINFVNTIKNKINAVNDMNNINNINDINKMNIIFKNQNPPNGIAKTMSSEINDNLNPSQIDEEITLRNDNFIFEDEKFNKGNNNETFDTIPMNEERSLGDTSLGGDINELLLRSMMTKKKSITEETITEELNSSSSKNLKKLNLLGNQDSLNNINFNCGSNMNDFMLQSQKFPQQFLKPLYNFSLTPNKNKFNLQNYNQQLEFNSKYNNNDSSMTNEEEINGLNIYNLNNDNNIDKQPNNKMHQIRTVYDKIQLKLKSSSNDKKDNKEKNNNIINNISNNIIIINDDNINNINIITDNSSSQSQEKILRNTGLFNGDQFTLLSNDINKGNNNENNNGIKTNQINIIGNNNIIQSERSTIKMRNILNKNILNLKKDSRDNNQKNFIRPSKASKIGVIKHKHSNSDVYNEEKKKQNLENNDDMGNNKNSTLNPKKNLPIKTDNKIKEKINKNIETDNNISFDSNSNSFRKKLLGGNNNLSKSFANLSGNNLDEFGENNNEKKDNQIKNEEKNKDNKKYMTINTIKSSKSQIETIKNNIYYESQNKNNKDVKEKKENKDINHTNYPTKVQKKNNNNNNNYNNINNNELKNNNKDIDIDKDNSGNIINSQNNNNQNVNNKKNSSNNVNNTNNTINKNKPIINEQVNKKYFEKRDEAYKRLKNDFEILLNERQNLFINKMSTINPTPINNSINTNMSITISLNNKIRKRQEEAFNNYFKNQKNKIDWDKVKIKFFQNNEFFIGMLDDEEKYPKKGILIASNGDYYDGEFVNGKKEGEGKLIYMNGNGYEGTFAAGRQNGKGKLTQIDGEIYDGEWKNGKMNGQGLRIHSNGDKYIGNHLNNARNGKGTYFFANGDSYDGEWVNGNANGRGVLKFRNGDIYDGDFKDNYICGKGKFKKKNGDIYIGEFKFGLINGRGKYINILGEQYIGGFLSGKKNGIGKLYNKEGKLIQSGNWKDDKFCGNVKELNSNI